MNRGSKFDCNPDEKYNFENCVRQKMWTAKPVQLHGIRGQQINWQRVQKGRAWKHSSPTTTKCSIPVRKNWRIWQDAFYLARPTHTTHSLTPTHWLVMTLLFQSTSPWPICSSLLTPLWVSSEGLFLGLFPGFSCLGALSMHDADMGQGHSLNGQNQQTRDCTSAKLEIARTMNGSWIFTLLDQPKKQKKLPPNR